MESPKGKRNNTLKMVLTGGHAATTAVAVIEEIKSEDLNWELYWIGVKNAIEGKKVVTLESEVLPRLGSKISAADNGQDSETFYSLDNSLNL